MVVVVVVNPNTGTKYRPFGPSFCCSYSILAWNQLRIHFWLELPRNGVAFVRNRLTTTVGRLISNKRSVLISNCNPYTISVKVIRFGGCFVEFQIQESFRVESWQSCPELAGNANATQSNSAACNLTNRHRTAEMKLEVVLQTNNIEFWLLCGLINNSYKSEVSTWQIVRKAIFKNHD